MDQRKYKYIVIFTVLLSICSISAVGYLFYKSYIGNKQVQILAQDNQMLTDRVWSLERGFLLSDKNTVEQIKGFESSITVLSKQVNQLSSHRTQIIRSEINYYINLASRSLLVNNDITTCLQFLEYANNYLNSVGDPIFNNLKYAISHDISNIQQLPTINKTEISAKLDSINQRVNNISYVNNSINIESSNIGIPTSLWDKFLYNLKHTLFSLVKISKVNDHSTMLLPEEEYMTRTQVRLELLNARLSVISNDNANWHSSLMAARQSILNYFVNDSTSHNLILQIDELSKLNIGIQDVNLDETMKALLQLNTLSGE